MRHKAFTPITVSAIKPHPSRRLEIPDGGCRGLILCVYPSGRRSWIMRPKQADGRSGKLTLGNADTLSLAEARKLASEINHKRAMGIDPYAERHATAVKAKDTFGGLVVQFVEEYCRPKLRTWRATANLLGLRPSDNGLEQIPGGLCARWHNRPVAGISGRDILDVLDECRRDAVPGLGRWSHRRSVEGQSLAVFARLRKFFSWCQGRLIIDRNPCAGLHRPASAPARDRVLNDAEIVAFWNACDGLGEPYGVVFKLLLLTGARRDEIARLTFDEISAGTIHLAASRVKSKRSHFIPLTPMALELIASTHRIHGNYVFTVSGKALSNFSYAKMRMDHMMQAELGEAFKPWRLHDCRRTCASRLAGLGVQPIVIEKILGHTSGIAGGLVGVYQRHDYTGERRAALEAWEGALQAIVT